MTELEALNWLKARKLWTISREGAAWTLTLWAQGPTRDSAERREYTVTEATGPGVAFVELVRLARTDEEAQR